MIKLTIPGYLTSFSSRKDGSLTLKFSTQEEGLGSINLKELQGAINSYGIISFDQQTEPVGAENI